MLKIGKLYKLGQHLEYTYLYKDENGQTTKHVKGTLNNITINNKDLLLLISIESDIKLWDSPETVTRFLFYHSNAIVFILLYDYEIDKYTNNFVEL